MPIHLRFRVYGRSLVALLFAVVLVNCGSDSSDDTGAGAGANTGGGAAEDGQGAGGGSGAGDEVPGDGSGVGDEVPAAARLSTYAYPGYFASEAGSEVVYSLIDPGNRLYGKIGNYYTNEGFNLFGISNATNDIRFSLLGDTAGSAPGMRSISTAKGKEIYTGLPDIVVRIKGGKEYHTKYARGQATVNIVHLSNFYHDAHFRDLRFAASATPAVFKDFPVKNANPLSTPVGEVPQITVGPTFLRVALNGSPLYLTGVNNTSTAGFDAVHLRLRASGSSSSPSLWYTTAKAPGWSLDKVLNFKVAQDGEFHDYYLPVAGLETLAGTSISEAFLNFPNPVPGALVDFEKIEFVNMDLHPDAFGEVTFHVFPNRIYEEDRVAFLGDRSQIEDIRIEYPIDADAASCYDGVALEPRDEEGVFAAGACAYELANRGMLAFVASPAPSNGAVHTIREGHGYRLIHHANIDQFVHWDVSAHIHDDLRARYPDFIEILSWGRRVFAEDDYKGSASTFLQEARRELSPLSSDAVEVAPIEGSPNYSGTVEFRGYRPLSGLYEVFSNSIGWGQSLLGNRNWYPGVEVTIQSPDDRQIYFQHTTDQPNTAGALQDEHGTTLPVQVELTRRLGMGSDATYYDPDRNGWGHTMFPVALKSNRSLTFRSLQIIQNWGSTPAASMASVMWGSASYTSTVGVSNVLDIRHFYLDDPRSDFASDVRGFSSDVQQWAMGDVGGAPEQWVNAGFFKSMVVYDQKGYEHPPVHQFSRVPIPSSSHYHYISKSDFMGGKADVWQDITVIPATDETRLLLQTDLEVKEDFIVDDVSRNLLLITLNYWADVNFGKFGYTVDDTTFATDGVVSIPTSGGMRATELPQKVRLAGEHPAFAVFGKIGGEFGDSGNMAVLVQAADMVIDGQPHTGPLALAIGHKRDRTLSYWLTLDETRLKFKAGDHIRLSLVVLPYGGGATGNETASAIETWQSFVKNPPLLVSVEQGSALKGADQWIPRVRANQEGMAEFTVKGGKHTITLRVEGFDKYAHPKVEVRTGGSWAPLTYSANGKDGIQPFMGADGKVAFAVPVPTDGGEHRYRFTQP